MLQAAGPLIETDLLYVGLKLSDLRPQSLEKSRLTEAFASARWAGRGFHLPLSVDQFWEGLRR